MKQLLFITLSFLSVSLSSCNEDDSEEKNIPPAGPKTVRVSRFKLFNQNSCNPRFYDVFNDTVYADSSKFFDLMFVQREATPNHRFMISSSTSEALDIEMKIAGKQYKKNYDNEVRFMTLPSSFRRMDFDTLQSEDALERLYMNSRYYYNEDRWNDCYYSDAYGWTPNDMFAFKINDKFGVAKIKDISPYKKNGEGYIELVLKFENN